MNRYDFMSMVDDLFKECNSTEELANRYAQIRKDLDSLYIQNIVLIATGVDS
jgi:hypothetical protein